MYARAVLSSSDPTLDVDRTLGADDAPATAYAYDELHRGDSVGRYLVLRPLGRGGMGAVYAAHDPELDRTVALKIVHRSGPRGVALKDEAQTLARLSHRNVVAVHDVGELPDGVFIAMEYVEGKTLRRWAEAHREDGQALASVMRDAGKGLAAAHQAGLVHLDFKPDNVMIADDGRVLVLDFGLAQPKERTGTGTDVAPAGTPAYMAPEMHNREPLDDRADQFSFCVTWLECALGQRPFPGDSPSAIARAIVDGDLVLPPRPATLPRAVWQALLRGVSNDPELRWPSMQALLEAVEPPRRTRKQTIVAATLAGTLSAVGVYAFAAPGVRCANASDGVATAWSKSDGEAIMAKAIASEDVLAAPHAEELVDRLSKYAVRLGDAYDEACRVTPEDTPQRLCLDARLEQLRATRDLALEEPVGEAEAEFDALQDITPCRRADEDSMFRDVSDPERARGLLARLARGEAMLERSKVPEARKELEAVVADAESLGWGAAESIARAQLSKAAATTGDREEMEREYERALELATMAGSDEAMYFALSTRIQELAFDGNVAAVKALAPVVAAIAQRAGRPTHTVYMALGNALQFDQDYAGAEEAYQEAYQAHPDLVVQLAVVSNLGGLMLYRGKFVEARELFVEALPKMQTHRGSSSVSALKMQANLADAEQQLGLLADARTHYEDALERYRAEGLAESRPAAHLALNYSTLLIGVGELEAAERVGAAAAEQLIALYGADHVYSIGARDFLNTLAYAQGRYAEAYPRTQTLISDMKALFGGEVPLMGFLRLSLSKFALELSETAAGLEALTLAEPLIASLNPEHPMLVSLFSLRTELLVQAEETGPALEAAEEAVRRSSGASVNAVDRGRAYFARARARIAHGDASTAVSADLEQAIANFEQMPAHPDGRLEAARALLKTPQR